MSGLAEITVGDEREAAGADASERLALALRDEDEIVHGDDAGAPSSESTSEATALAVIDSAGAPAGQEQQQAAVETDPNDQDVDWVYDLNGQPYTQPGAKLNPVQRRISFNDDAAYKRALSRMRQGGMFETVHRREMQRMVRENQQLKQLHAAELSSYKLFLGEFEKLLADDINNRSAVALLLEMRHNAPELRARAMLEEAKARQQLPAGGETRNFAAEQDPAEVIFEVQQAVTRYVTTDPSFQALPWLTEKARAKILEALTSESVMDRYVLPATPQDVQEGRARFVGQWVLHWDRAGREWEREAASWIAAHAELTAERERIAEEREALNSVAPVIQSNNRTVAKANAQAGVIPPANQPAPTRAQAQGKPSNRAEAFAKLRNDLAAADDDDD